MTQTNTVSSPVESPSSVLAGLVDELTAKAQAGEVIDLEAVLLKHPEHAVELRQLWTALGALHDLSRSREEQLAAVAPLQGDVAGLETGVLGDFRLIRQVGRGGMGVVYEAEQISLRRRVALKVLAFASALDSRQLQRFQNEAQAAAHLHHTHIVPVFFVGCERGVHFYAMQYVEGQNLAAVIAGLRELVARKGGPRPTGPSPLNADTVDPPAGQVVADADMETAPVLGVLSTARSSGDAQWFRTVAELAVSAAEALDYAHKQGVVHRDIKPANLLVDGHGHLWVADFGLAQMQSTTRITMTGDLVGTLRYMSPEQALAKRVAVDHRTDVYSLGATLYELLTLQPAFTGTDRQELLRQIAFEEPRPPRSLNKIIPKELEIIALKALEKNPAERYATAQEMADDLRRFLEDKPIMAKPPSLAQRVGKWARRHPELVAASVGLLLITALGLAVSTFLLSRANSHTNEQRQLAEDRLDEVQKEQEKAVKEAAKAKAITRFLVEDLLGQVTPENVNPDKKVTLEEVLERADRKIDRAFPDQPEVEAFVRLTLGRVYSHLTLPAMAEPHMRKAVKLYRDTVGPGNEDTLRATSDLANLLGWGLNKFDEAEALAAPNIEDCRRLLGPEHPLTLLCTANMACFLQKGGKSAEALALNRQILEIHLRVHGPCHPATLELMRTLSMCLKNEGSLAEAEALARWAAEASPRFLGAENLAASSAVHVLSLVLQDQGRLEEAETLMRRVVEVRRRAQGPANGSTANATHTLAELLHSQGRPVEAEPLYREALEKYRDLRLMGRNNGPAAMRGLALVLKDRGNLDEAESLARQAIQVLREPSSKDRADGLVTLGIILTAAGKAVEAEPLLHEGLNIRRNALPKDHWAVADAASVLGGCLAALQRYPEAEPLLLTSYESLQKDEQVQPRVLREAHERLVKLYETWDKPNKAQEWRAKGIPLKEQRVLREKWTAEMHKERQKLYRLMRDKSPATPEQYNQLAWILAAAFDPEVRDRQLAVELAQKAVELDPNRGECWGTLGTALYRAGEPKAAIEALQKATQLRKDGADFFFLAMAHGQLGDQQPARAWYDQARQWMEKNKPTDEDLRHFRAETAALLGIKEQPTRKSESPPAKEALTPPIMTPGAK
jgi:serine/threonine protein kinase/Flp pilus assembly protein TadD